MIYKSEIFNNIKYDLVEDFNSKNAYASCGNCTFFKKKDTECGLKNNVDCLAHGHNTYWKLSISHIRKQKLIKLNDQ